VHLGSGRVERRTTIRTCYNTTGVSLSPLNEVNHRKITTGQFIFPSDPLVLTLSGHQLLVHVPVDSMLPEVPNVPKSELAVFSAFYTSLSPQEPPS